MDTETVSYLYAVMAFTGAVTMALLLKYHSTDHKVTKEDKALSVMMGFSLAFCIVDGIWGAFASAAFKFSVTGYSIFTIGFHAMATVTAYVWYRYNQVIFEDYRPIWIRIVMAVPMIGALGMLLSNPFTQWIYHMDSNGNYVTGPFRMILFIVQLFYFLVAFIKALVNMLTEADAFTRSRYNTVIISLIIPMAFGILQLWFPNAPFYSIGYMISAILIFTGSISQEREKGLLDDSVKYKNKSLEVYKALVGLADSYVSLQLLNVELNTLNVVAANNQGEYGETESLENEAHNKIINDARNDVNPKDLHKLIRFVDTYTLSDRMRDKDLISLEYQSESEGYCIASFKALERDSNGSLVKVLYSIQNINDIKQREINYEMQIKEALENENEIYGEMLQLQETGVIVFNEEDYVVVINDKMKKLFKTTREEAMKTKIGDFFQNAMFEQEERRIKDYYRVKEEGGFFESYFYMRDINEGLSYYIAGSKGITLKNGTKYVVITVTDITKNKQTEQKFKILSETDALTGLNNRGCGEAKTEKLLQDNQKGFFCILDINKFKNINDTYGHMVGDKALESLADCLKKTFRENDVIMRLGGDEFAVYAPGLLNEESALNCIERFFDNIRAINIPEMKGDSVTASLGGVFCDEDTKAFDDLYKRADSVMYECKSKAGNNYAFYK